MCYIKTKRVKSGLWSLLCHKLYFSAVIFQFISVALSWCTIGTIKGTIHLEINAYSLAARNTECSKIRSGLMGLEWTVIKVV